MSSGSQSPAKRRLPGAYQAGGFSSRPDPADRCTLHTRIAAAYCGLSRSRLESTPRATSPCSLWLIEPGTSSSAVSGPSAQRVNPAPHRRPPSSAVSALVLSFTAPLLRLFLRVSAAPRQNHTLALSWPVPPRPRPWHGALRSLRLVEAHPPTFPTRNLLP